MRPVRRLWWFKVGHGTFPPPSPPPPSLWLVATNHDYSLDCGTTPQLPPRARMLRPTTSQMTTNEHNTTKEGRAMNKEERRGGLGRKGLSNPHSYAAACSARASPSSASQTQVPSTRRRELYIPPYLYFSPPTDGTQVYCNNYLLDFLHCSVPITACCTFNRIHCPPITYWTGLCGPWTCELVGLTNHQKSRGARFEVTNLSQIPRDTK